MTNVWLLPESDDTAPDAQDGDVLLRHRGASVEVGKATGTDVQWLGDVPAESLPGAAPVDAVTAAPELLIAATGVAGALSDRGA